MEKAINEAKAKLPEFKRLLNKPEEGMENFAVKVAFPVDDGNEHMWVSDLEITDGV